jgi:hypothetical protein
MNRRLTRIALAAALAITGTFAFASSASATFHLNLIREVHTGTGGSGTGGYIELQSYADGQNFVAGKHIVTYDSAGNVLTNFTIPGNVANGQNQRTILISDGGPIGATPDFSGPINVVSPAGSACFTDSAITVGVDCVSWGATLAPTGPPSPVGMPALFFGAGLGPNQTIERTISRGCATALDAPDDTNDSAADFAPAAASPRNNSMTPTEMLCGTNSAKKCKKKKHKTGGGVYSAKKHKKCKKKKRK